MPELKMKPTYKMFFLDDDDFDNLHKDLPYMTKAKLKDSLGFANPKTGEAYVRKTGVAELDDITIEHELQELLAKTSPDEIDGIRYKKGGIARFIVPALLSLVPGVGPILAAASNVGMTQYAKAGHPEQLGEPGKPLDILGEAATGYFGGKAVAGGVSGGIAGGTAAAPGLLSKAGGIVSGVAKGAMTGSSGINTNILGKAPIAGLQGPVTQAQSQLGYTNLSQVPQNLLGSTAAGAAAGALAAKPLQGPVTAAQAAQGFSNLSQVPTATSTLGATPISLGTINAAKPATAIQTTTPAIQGAGQVTPAVTPAPAAAPFSLKSLVTPQNILGAGSLLASTAGKQPEFVMPESVEAIRSKLLQTGAEGGLTEVGQQARLELGNIMKSTPTELYPTATDEYYAAIMRRTQTAYDEAQKQLDSSYNLAGVYGSGEHLAEKAKLQENLARTESALAAETEQRRFELARTEKYNALQTALGIDKDVMDDLVGISGLSAEVAAQIYGAQVKDVQILRESLGTLGIELLMRGQTKSQGGQTLGQ